jgi:transposase
MTSEAKEERMRGDVADTDAVFSYISPAQRVPKDHPLRPIREMSDLALKELSPRFSKLYSHTGRPSIPPERLLRALLLQVLYSIRSERMLIEQLDYNMLFRWFVGLGMDDAVWDATTFTKNRDRLLAGDIAQLFFEQVSSQARVCELISDEHFTVDGTLVEAWAGLKSFKKKTDKRTPPPDDPGNPTINFHGEKRKNDTHQSTTDPQARLYRKANGHEAKLCFIGHVVMENRNGLAVAGRVTQAHGRAEVETSLALVEQIARAERITVGGDKGYDNRPFVDGLRERNATPHVAQKMRYSAIDGRVTRYDGYEVSQRRRKRVEEIFGWLKTVALMRKTKVRGVARVDWMFTLALAAYNLVRMRNLVWIPA